MFMCVISLLVKDSKLFVIFSHSPTLDCHFYVSMITMVYTFNLCSLIFILLVFFLAFTCLLALK